MGWVGGSLDGFDQTIISTACSFQRIYNHNNIRSIILKIKTTDIKSLKYYYFVLFPDNVFKISTFSGKRRKY